jgi:hypothetical protein
VLEEVYAGAIMVHDVAEDALLDSVFEAASPRATRCAAAHFTDDTDAAARRTAGGLRTRRHG